MRVGFAKARTGYADEPRAGTKIVDRRRAGVAHARAESADELMHDRGERTERANATLDALGDKLGELADVRLSVAVARTPRLHRAKRAHPAIRLKRAVLGFHDIAGRFIHAREKSTEHHGPRAGADRLRDVAGVLDPTVGAHGNAVPVRRLRAVEDRRDLWHPGSRDDSRRADRPRAHPHLDAVGAGRDQLLGTFGRGHIPA